MPPGILGYSDSLMTGLRHETVLFAVIVLLERLCDIFFCSVLIY
jgi:hypothetical protein